MAAYDFDTFFYAGIPPHLVSSGYDADCPALTVNYSEYSTKLTEYAREYNTVDHPDVKYLYDMIDMTYWLPITDLGHWAKNVSPYDFRTPGDPHPSTEQHIDFTQRVILPFLKKKYNLSP
jgi:hypothetical protein